MHLKALLSKVIFLGGKVSHMQTFLGNKLKQVANIKREKKGNKNIHIATHTI